MSSTNVRRYDMGRLVEGKQPPAPVEKQAPKTTAELRRFLLSEMLAVADGKRTTEQTKQVCSLAEQVYKTVKLEIEYVHAMKLLESVDKIPAAPEIALFSDEGAVDG